jgi:hypothetical protein
MGLMKTVLVWSALWVSGITGLHLRLNLDPFRDERPAGRTFKVGFLPNTRPVNPFVQKRLRGDGGFEDDAFQSQARENGLIRRTLLTIYRNTI